MNTKKRLGIFVFYDDVGYVGRYVDYLLQDMVENLMDLVIVCNGTLSDKGRCVFQKYTNRIYIRENSGFDGTAWKEAVIQFLGFDELAQYDEAVFFNDICYGPVYPFREVFQEMDQKVDLDFWGLTKHFEARDFTGHHKSHIIPEHIQTYFFVVRQKMLVSKDFRTFWTEMSEIKTFSDDIGAFETRFTEFFSSRGFKWDTYVYMEDLKGRDLDNYCFNYDWPCTLLERRMPMIRRKSLTQFVPNSCIGPEKEARRALRYIEEKTNYDISIIWEDLLRKNNVADLYTRLHLNYILPTESVIYRPLAQRKIALLMHIYYADQVDYCFQYASNMPAYADVYITTIEKNKGTVENRFSKLKCNKLEIRVIQNRGRDMSALYIGCADVLKNNKYDYICCIHDKKSPQVGMLFGMSFRDLTFENTLASKAYVENVIGLLDRNPQLGYLGFPYMIGGPYWPVLANAWASDNNFSSTKAILNRCGINVKVSIDKPPIVYANVFWCRPKALKPLSDLQLTYEDFDHEPLGIDGTFSHALERAVTYVAQSQGYYSGVLYTDEYASIYLPALMLEYSRVFYSYGSLLKAANENDIKTNNHVMHKCKTIIKCCIKRTLKPFPKLYNVAASTWKRMRGR